jgi:hypothetical protein
MANQFSLVYKWHHKVQRHLCTLRRHLYTSESWFFVVKAVVSPTSLPNVYIIQASSQSALVSLKPWGEFCTMHETGMKNCFLAAWGRYHRQKVSSPSGTIMGRHCDSPSLQCGRVSRPDEC